MRKPLVAILLVIAICTLCACSAKDPFILRKENGNYICDGLKNPQDANGELYIPSQIGGKEVSRIGGNAFKDSGLTGVEIGSGIQRIGDYAFGGSEDLEVVELPRSLKYIGMSAFMDCTALKEIHLPLNVTTMDIWAFYGCSALETVVIEGEMETLDREVFKDCKNLKVIYLPDTITHIYSGALDGCNALEEIHFAGSTDAFVRIDFSYDWLSAKDVLVCCTDGNILLEDHNTWSHTDLQPNYPTDPVDALSN